MLFVSRTCTENSFIDYSCLELYKNGQSVAGNNTPPVMKLASSPKAEESVQKPPSPETAIQPTVALPLQRTSAISKSDVSSRLLSPSDITGTERRFVKRLN